MGIQAVNFRKEPTGWRGVLNQWAQTVKRPIEWCCYVASPTKNPSAILDRINKAAVKGIEKAKKAGIQVESRSPRINNELNHALQQQGVGEAALARPEVGAVADLAPYENDPEITQAIPLQDRVDRTDWHQRTEDSLNQLIDKVSVFTALIQMRNWAGIPEANNLKIMRLVKQATDARNPISVWDLFASQYEPSFSQMLYAGFFYWIFYMTSLINNTVKAYLRGFIDDITRDLAPDSSEDLTTEDLTADSNEKTRIKLFTKIIENVNDFLKEDIEATKAYANGTERGLLKEIRERAIKRHYGFSLETLCENFSAKVIEGDPRVKIFEDFQSIPILGSLFRAFEWVVNKLIVQRLMMHSILPNVLKELVMNGKEATQPDQLPFKIAMTRFFKSQLQNLENDLEKDEMVPDSTPMAGTEELLPATIELLLEALEYEGKKGEQGKKRELSPLALRKKIAKFDKGGILADSLFKSRIETSIVEAGNTLFSFLNETVKSGKLFATLIELSMTPFEGEEKTKEMLEAEYDEEFKQLERVSESVFKRLVRKAILKAIPGQSAAAESAHQFASAKESLARQSIIANELITKMDEIAERMKQKVAASQVNPEETNIQGDIAEFLEMMQIFGSRKEFQDKMKKLEGTNQNEIWRRFTPLFKKIESVQKKIFTLQDLSDQYPQHATVARQLGQIKALCTTLQDQFQELHLRYPQTPILIQSLRRSVDEISQALGADAPVPVRLEQILQETSKFSTTIAKEQNAVDSIFALYPPTGDGLLDQLRAYQRGMHPRGFRPRECLESIAHYLTFFSRDEKREAQRLIGNGAHIEDRWDEIEALLQNIRDNHMQLRDQGKASLGLSLNETKKWLDRAMFKYNHRRDKDCKKMQENMIQISTQMRELKNESREISPSLTPSLSSKIMKTFSLVIPPAIGAYFGAPTAIGAGIGFAGFNLLQSSDEWSNESWIRSTTKKGIGIGASIALSSYVPTWLGGYLPNWKSWVETGTSLVSGAYIGTSAVNIVTSGIEKYAFNEVWDMFSQVRLLSMDSRIYYAATTRTMVAMTS